MDFFSTSNFKLCFWDAVFIFNGYGFEKKNLIAYKNDRGLHELPTPTAGGMIFLCIYFSILTELFMFKYVNISTIKLFFYFFMFFYLLVFLMICSI